VYLLVVGVVQGQVHVHGVLVQVHEVVLHGHDAHKIDQDEEGSPILCSCLVVGVIQGQVHVHGVLLQVHGVVAHGHNSQQIGQGGVGSLLCVPGSRSCARSMSGVSTRAIFKIDVFRGGRTGHINVPDGEDCSDD
jgi:hypothetical protein